MVTVAFYLAAQAAKMLGISEDQLLQLIKAGKIKAVYRDNVGSYMISNNDIQKHMRKTRNLGGLQEVVGKRLLMFGQDPDLQGLIKMDFDRRSNTQVHIATSERDMDLSIDEFMPDVIIVHLAALLRPNNSVQNCLKKAKSKMNPYLIVYHSYSAQMIEDSPDIKRQLRATNADEIVSILGGSRPLVQAISKQL